MDNYLGKMEHIVGQVQHGREQLAEATSHSALHRQCLEISAAVCDRPGTVAITVIAIVCGERVPVWEFARVGGGLCVSIPIAITIFEKCERDALIRLSVAIIIRSVAGFGGDIPARSTRI